MLDFRVAQVSESCPSPHSQTGTNVEKSPSEDSMRAKTFMSPLPASDVAVDIRSPSDGSDDLAHRIATLLRVGTRAVFVIDPDARTVTAHDATGAHALPVPGTREHPALRRAFRSWRSPAQSTAAGARSTTCAGSAAPQSRPQATACSRGSPAIDLCAGERAIASWPLADDRTSRARELVDQLEDRREAPSVPHTRSSASAHARSWRRW